MVSPDEPRQGGTRNAGDHPRETSDGRQCDGPPRHQTRQCFFGAHSDEDYPAYPAPRLAYFGLAIETSLNDGDNPDVYQGMGSDGYRAPEVALANDHILGAADIWSIGATVMTLMDLSHEVSPDQFYPFDQSQWKAQLNRCGDGPDQDFPFFTNTLTGLVERCVEPIANQRITATELLREIDAHTSSPDETNQRDDQTNDQMGSQADHQPNNLPDNQPGKGTDDEADDEDDDESGDLAEGMRTMDAAGAHPRLLLNFHKGHDDWPSPDDL